MKFIDKIKEFLGFETVLVTKTGNVGPSEMTADLLTMLSAKKYDTSKDILVLPKDYVGALPHKAGPVIRVACKQPALIRTGYIKK